ncbi:MAG: MogA/MoaB family molybdenum cofactor biosynthesis protein [Nitrospinae bacterium]|nr:MogA/MoaB family molybdenum cofactor biosynthesis protein [Nitrospinota bacterium]
MSIALLVVSDRASTGVRPDQVEPAMRAFLEKQGESLAHCAVVPDEKGPIAETVARWADSGDYDLILTAGGTGLSPRDVTPEAVKPLLERDIPGIPEIMRAESFKITPNAPLSRGYAGCRGRAMIINLPGSPKAAVENLSFVWKAVAHGVVKLKGDMGDCAPA